MMLGDVASRPGYRCRSPLRGLDPSGGYPSSPPFASLTPRSAWPGGSLTLSAACWTAAAAQRSTTSLGLPPRPPRAGASRRARRSPRLARPGRLRRLRASPRARRRGTPCVAGAGFAAHRARALPAAVLAALVRALLRSATALRFAPRRAPVPAPVRTPPPSPSAACCARLPAVVRAHRPPLNRRGGSPPPASPASIPRTSMPSGLAVPDRPSAAFWSHTRRIVDARRARRPMRRLTPPNC